MIATTDDRTHVVSSWENWLIVREWYMFYRFITPSHEGTHSTDIWPDNAWVRVCACVHACVCACVCVRARAFLRVENTYHCIIERLKQEKGREYCVHLKSKCWIPGWKIQSTHSTQTRYFRTIDKNACKGPKHFRLTRKTVHCFGCAVHFRWKSSTLFTQNEMMTVLVFD